MPESILIATLGAEPQVVTLTLDALLARGEVINLVEVVHTDASQSPIFDALKALETVFIVEKFYGQAVRYQPISLRGAGGALQDLTSAAEIETAFHALYSLLRDHKRLHHRIHLCIAGGRKTTTVFAMAAARAVLDSEDHVWVRMLLNPLRELRHFFLRVTHWRIMNVRTLLNPLRELRPAMRSVFASECFSIPSGNYDRIASTAVPVPIMVRMLLNPLRELRRNCHHDFFVLGCHGRSECFSIPSGNYD